MSRDPDEVWFLWPDGPPGETPGHLVGEVVERSSDPAWRDRAARTTTAPTLSLVRPERPNGASVLLIPGGAYQWVVIDKEGFDIAEVFVAAGVTCFVLSYRLPCDGWAVGPLAPLQDAQRAMRMIRATSDRLDLDPGRVAVLGASAGGHLAGWMAVGSAAYDPSDATDDLQYRPDLTLLLYPVASMGTATHEPTRDALLGPGAAAEERQAHSLEAMDWTGTVPVWMAHAIDDPYVPVENATDLLASLRRAGVPAEAHLFHAGGHGFAIRWCEGRSVRLWPELAMEFGRDHGWLRE